MMEQLQTALSALKVLRSSVGEVFYCLANGIRADHGEDSSKENKYLFEIQELLTTVGTNLRYFSIIIHCKKLIINLLCIELIVYRLYSIFYTEFYVKIT